MAEEPPPRPREVSTTPADLDDHIENDVFWPSGGNSPTRQSMTVQQLESSICAHDECQTAQLPGPSGLKLSSSDAEMQYWMTFLKDFLRKWRTARAQHPVSGSEKL